MKNFLFAALLLLTGAMAQAQSSTGVSVDIFVKNDSWLPRKFTLIGYTPGEQGNWTNGFWLVPGGRKRYSLKVGTTIYLANRAQVGVVMGGGSLRSQPPLITVGAGDADKVFGLN